MLMAIVSLMGLAQPGQHRRASAAPGGQHRAGRRATARAEPAGARHRPAQRHPGGDRPAHRRRAEPGDSLPPGLALKRLSEIPLRLDIVAPVPSQARRYSACAGGDRAKILYRAASPSGDRLPLPPLAERVAVLDDVSRFEIRAWVPERLDAPAGTQQSHASRLENQPVAGHPQRRGALSTVVALQ